MLISSKDISEWDLRNEINKVNVRWAILIITLPYLYWQYFQRSFHIVDSIHDSKFLYITVLAFLTTFLNIIYNIFLVYKRKKKRLLHPSMKYISMIFDLSIVTFLLPPTGGNESMFFLLYIVVLLSNGMRYGMRLAVVGILVFNTFYLVMLFFQYYPETQISELNREILKVMGVWIVGLYIGYLARRFQMLHGEVDKYKNLLKKHMDSVAERGNTQ
jgi:hypothetical protein